MQFGLVEVRFSPAPQLATSSVGHDFILLGRAHQSRAGEGRTFRPSQPRRRNHPGLERKYLAIDLNDVKNGLLPEGASQDLIQALQGNDQHRHSSPGE
jgi:hypothetical protein